MLTILWRKPCGSEQIFEAETLHRLQIDGEEFVPAQGDFLAHGVTQAGAPSDYFQFGIAAPFGAVFVMNEKGRTVASYFARPGTERQRAEPTCPVQDGIPIGTGDIVNQTCHA